MHGTTAVSISVHNSATCNIKGLNRLTHSWAAPAKQTFAAAEWVNGHWAQSNMSSSHASPGIWQELRVTVH